MNSQEYRQLQAEKGALERLLADLSADREIERIGLEVRKQEVEEALASQPAPGREPVRARLTFRGKPIVGGHGIFAEFGALAVGTFAEAVASIGASQIGPLGSRGILPGRDELRMLITGTAPGSFGFLLEEAPVDGFSQLPQESLLEPAIDRTKAIMQASLGTDDELTEALAEADPRALEAIRRFLETMARGEAACAIELEGDVFRYADVEQVRRSIGRLGQDNIHEKDERLSGRFQGVLPHRRTFEFRVSETNEVITGRVGKSIADAASINRALDRPVTIEVHSRRVGEGRPRYVLLRYETN
ncbi:MAG: hypothetical protein V2A73_18230 [Pseudomonadota bacterium]